MRSWIGTGVTVLVLVFVMVFAWRVVHYANLIQEGRFETQGLSFVDELTISEAALAVPITDGAYDVVTEDDPQLGSPDARVTIVEFADFGCPYSRKSSFVLRSLAQQYSEDVRYIYRDFPIVELHPQAERAAEAAECANVQGKFWEYHDKLYLNQTDLSDARLIEYAREVNLDADAFANCLESGQFEAEVAEDYAAGIEAGVRGTPTFFINGNQIPGSIPEDVLDAVIQNILES